MLGKAVLHQVSMPQAGGEWGVGNYHRGDFMLVN